MPKVKIRVGNGVNFSKNFSSESLDETLKEMSEFIPIPFCFALPT